jgi:hypothetical protein
MLIRGQDTMRARAKNAATTLIPVQLSATDFHTFIFPPRSMPRRGPQGKLGSHGLWNLIVWVLYTGMPWKCVPIPQDPHGQPAIHDTSVYRAFAPWAPDGALEQAFMASVAPLSAEPHRDRGVLHGDGTNTVAPKGVMGAAPRALSPTKGSQASPLRTTMAMCSLPSPSHRSMRRLWCCSRRGCKRARRWPHRSVWTSETPMSISTQGVIPRTIARAYSRPA